MEAIKVEFRIRFDGTAPGLKDHRLSFASFGNALHHLLQAFRRAADRESKNGGSGADEEGSRRFGKYGGGIDLQLAKIEDGCTTLAFQCVFPQSPDIDHVAERTVGRVIHSIEMEANGREAISPSVRKFLEALPKGVEVQEYEGRVNGKVVKKIALGEMPGIEERRNAPPRLARIVGRVVSVSFTPDRESIRIRTTEKESVTCLAESHLIEKVFALRNTTVVAQLLERHDLKRLLAIRGDTEKEPEVAQNQRLEFTLGRWDELLRRLA